MPLWNCDFQGCRRPALQGHGDCLLCDRHLCRHHLKADWHDCPDPELNWDEYTTQYVNAEARRLLHLSNCINGPKLLERASLLRNGTPCTADLSPKALAAMMGGQNCHAVLEFEDGVKWIARFRPEQVTSPPPAVRDYILRSEVATMLFLQERCPGVPSPEVYDWACEADPENEIGLGYILMQKMEGKVLKWETATREQRDKVLGQLVDIYLELERHPFTSMGSLTLESSHNSDRHTVQMGALATPALFGRRTGKPPGPFKTACQGARAINEAILSMIAAGEIGALDPVDSYLMHRFWADLSDRYWDEPHDDDGTTTDDDTDGDDHNNDNNDTPFFYLKHPDDKGDHLLVNDAYDIVALIDWEGARTAPKEEAFASPSFTWPVAAFHAGAADLAAAEVRLARLYDARDRPDLTRCVLDGRRVQRLAFAVDNLNSGARDARALFRGLRLAFDEGEEGEDLGWDDWRDGALERYGEDGVLQDLLRG
ncbi:hypothetical protein PG991_010843 [Apiospora marii]|uniref:Aminoglycoside phosphotransferase domain-containing protein n=1 Tax=Apiospora marii TaxID=335849 RepID=A0ABR1RCE3_9PEZI